MANGRRVLWIEAGGWIAVPPGRPEHFANRTQEQTRIRSEPQHAKPLLFPLPKILRVAGQETAMLFGAAQSILQLQDLFGDAWPFPLAAMTRARGEIDSRPSS